MMNAQQSLPRIYREWKTDDEQIANTATDLRKWMAEVNQLGIPHFGEAGNRLKKLRRELVEHFRREDQMVLSLAQEYPPTSPEVAAVKRQSRRDHEILLQDLDRLIDLLKEDDPEYPSWTAAMDDVDLFFDRLEQHEEQETESMRILMPTAVGNG